MRMIEKELEDMAQIQRIKDFEKLDNTQIYLTLQNAKDLLTFLHDEYDEFPYSAYFDGTEKIREAMTFIDDNLIHQEVNQSC